VQSTLIALSQLLQALNGNEVKATGAKRKFMIGEPV
jgi:hypothetical protein